MEMLFMFLMPETAFTVKRLMNFLPVVPFLGGAGW